MDPVEYRRQRQEMANKRKVCLACETEEWLNNASAEELEAAQPCADPHGGPYCKKIQSSYDDEPSDISREYEEG